METKTVWLYASGCVKGVPLEWLNSKIDYYNCSLFLRKTGDFWGWLSWEEGEEFRGIYPLLNTDIISKVHTIKKGDFSNDKF